MAFTSTIPTKGINALYDGQRAVVQTPNGDNYILIPASVSSGMELYKSTNGGLTWALVTSNTQTATSFGHAYQPTQSSSSVAGCYDAVANKIHYIWTFYIGALGAENTRYSSYDIASNTWTDGETLRTQIFANNGIHSIVADSAGGIHVLHPNNNDSYPDIIHRYKPSGGAWTAGSNLASSFSSSPINYAALAANASGEVTITYGHADSVGQAPFIRTMKWSGGSWGTLYQVGSQTNTDSSARSFSSTYDKDGKVLTAIWASEGGSQQQGIYLTTWTGAANPTLTKILTSASPPTGYTNAAYQMLGLYCEKVTGDLFIFFIVSNASVGANNGVSYVKKPYGGAWSAPVKLASQPAGTMPTWGAVPANGSGLYIPIVISDHGNSTVYSDTFQVLFKVKYRTQRVQTASGISNIPLYPPNTSGVATSNLRLKVDGTHTHCVVELGLITDPKASPWRIMTPAGVRAILKE